MADDCSSARDGEFAMTQSSLCVLDWPSRPKVCEYRYRSKLAAEIANSAELHSIRVIETKSSLLYVGAQRFLFLPGVCLLVCTRATRATTK